MMERSTKVVLDLLAGALDRLVLAEEGESLSDLVGSVVGLTRHGAKEVGDAKGEVDHGLLGGEVVGAEEIDCGKTSESAKSGERRGEGETD